VKAGEIAQGIAERNRQVEAAGFAPQVQDVPGLSLVFTSVSGARRRIPIKAAKKDSPGDIGPNVLLRPVVERAILPTATYIGGPAEISYFAQLSPIAEALAVPRPTIMPRWSALIIEPHVGKTLEKLSLLPEDFRDPHEVETRVARAHVPKPVLDELEATRSRLEQKLDELSDAAAREPVSVSPAVTAGLRANLMRRLDRFERRLLAAAKKQHAGLMSEIATARGSLFPLGKPQERALNFVPLLARYGPALRDDMLAEARTHAQSLIGAGASPPRLEPLASGRGRS
jgi:bacillithiol synthase